ncbi:MAG: hypothetical protein Q7R45_15135 [Sulfuricaulis sp.]|nr:hypothetical protein [Sulfuricaulis sp.]
MARAYSGCKVWQQDFLRLDLPDNHLGGELLKALTGINKRRRALRPPLIQV